MKDEASFIAPDTAPSLAGDYAALHVALSETPETSAPDAPAGTSAAVLAYPELAALVEAYRTRGFLAAATNPLMSTPPTTPRELAPEACGLDARSPRVRMALTQLHAAYCGAIGWEFGHIHDAGLRRFFSARAEGRSAPAAPRSAAARLDALKSAARARAFETTMAQRLPGAKLFGLGGAESFNVLIETLIARSAAASGVDEVVVGGMHRGRFNMLANVFGKPLAPMLSEIKGGAPVPDGLGVSSDVSYHLGFDGVRSFAGREVYCTISAHPSHLQLIPIISQGRARARQMRAGREMAQVLPLLLHTDASFAGQGLVAEMMQLSRLAPFDLGGTIHVIINNQVGFTTDPDAARTARHCTDIARMIDAPVLHVNGDDIDAVLDVAEVAADWRARHGRDILIDLVCYRRPGHNEIDEPRFTQPELYRAIDARPPVDEIYAGRLAAEGLDPAVADMAAAEMRTEIDQGLKDAAKYRVNEADWFQGRWSGLKRPTENLLLTPVQTGMDRDSLIALGRGLTTLPDGFAPHPKVARFLEDRRASFEGAGAINWATAEALALASFLADGTPVRFGGQDSLRGAFTQRHLEVHDMATGARHLTVAGAASPGPICELHNTPLTEHAVVCFEYGITLDDPGRFVMWEAQFGEFLNIAQPVFDQAIACGADRWLRASGLVILLPHGLDGGGADHSTGRPERLLAAYADANLVVANVSTPANFFHLLRRQMVWPTRVPLVVLTPKALLRHKACVSPLADFETGTGFVPVLPDPDANYDTAERVIVTTGKAFYVLDAARRATGLTDKVALVRIEQLAPFPTDALRNVLMPYRATDVVWCEEEPANMGYHLHLAGTLAEAAGRPVRRFGRAAAATPAVGVKSWLEVQEAAYIADAFARLSPT